MKQQLVWRGEEHSVRTRRGEGGEWELSVDEQMSQFRWERLDEHTIRLQLGDRIFIAYVARSGTRRYVFVRGVHFVLDEASAATGAPAAPDAITPPTPAMVVRVLVGVGQEVAAGDPLVIVSAMKMETTLRAPAGGVVKAVRVAEGDQVAPGDRLIEVE